MGVGVEPTILMLYSSKVILTKYDIFVNKIQWNLNKYYNQTLLNMIQYPIVKRGWCIVASFGEKMKYSTKEIEKNLVLLDKLYITGSTSEFYPHLTKISEISMFGLITVFKIFKIL